MTETAAIALMILDQRPDLAPRRDATASAVSAPAGLAGGRSSYLYLCRLPGTLGARRREQLVENCRQYRKNLISGSNSSWPPGRGRWARR